MIALLAFFIPLGLYFAWPSTYWYFDAIACASALELGQGVNLVHGNHLLYGLGGYLFWKALLLPLGITRALLGLQIYTSLLSAVGLAGLYQFLHLTLKDKVQALLVTVLTSTFAGFWFLSIEPNPYALGFLGLSWAAYFLFREDQTAMQPVWVGLFHGLAVLGHITHGLWVVPALYAFWTTPQPTDKKRRLMTYLSVLALTTLLPYLFIMGLVVGPHLGYVPLRLWRWFLGTVAIEGGGVGKSHWNFPGASFLFLWFKGSFKQIWGTFWPYTMHPSQKLWGFTVLSMATMALPLVRSLEDRKDRLWRFAMLWIGTYALFFFTWEPDNIHYRMGDVVPLALLISLGLKKLKSARFFYGFGGLGLALLLAVNLQTRIRPMSRLEKNTVYSEVSALSHRTAPESLYLTTGGTRWLYFLYFSGRQAWNVAENGAQGAVTADRLRQALARGPVYLYEEAGLSPNMQNVLVQFHLTPIAENPLWFQVQ